MQDNQWERTVLKNLVTRLFLSATRPDAKNSDDMFHILDAFLSEHTVPKCTLKEYAVKMQMTKTNLDDDNENWRSMGFNDGVTALSRALLKE